MSLKTGVRLEKIINAMDSETLSDYNDAAMRKAIDALNKGSRSSWDNVQKAIDTAKEYANV